MVKPSEFQVYNASAGSGKTFTLVKEYLRVLLRKDSPWHFRRILAITFTNKAAAEMKERVMKYLLDFSLPDSAEEQAMREILEKETGLTEPQIRQRSLSILQQILRDYSSFHIQTIDSFTNKLIKSFAFDLGLSMDFEVELDVDAILQEAVDQLIHKIGMDKELTRILLTFAREKTMEDKSWDISRDLFDFSKLLVQEDHLEELDKMKLLGLEDFWALYDKLRKRQAGTESKWKQIAEEALDAIGRAGLEHKDFLRSQVPKFFAGLKRSPGSVKFITDSSIDKNMEARNFYGKTAPETVKQGIDSIAEELYGHYRAAFDMYPGYQLDKLVRNNVVPIAVLQSVHKELETLKENNNIRLNAEFNQLISDHLREQPAAFIYEKIGEKFKNYFIDEMQDTSVLQWQNLIPLLDNTLSQEETGLLLVGDAKQAIYRWRGGRAEQFIDLASEGYNPFQTPKRVMELEYNYRSCREVVEFNNDLFSYISESFQNPSYRELYKTGCKQKTTARDGGYVELRFLDGIKNNQARDETYPVEIHQAIQELLEDYEPSDICVLVRKKSQGAVIAKYLTEQGLRIISSETLQLQNNRKIEFIIQFMRLMRDFSNQDALYDVAVFLFDHLEVDQDRHEFLAGLVHLDQDDFFEALRGFGVEFDLHGFESYSVLESAEAVIRSFGLAEGSDAFLQFFLDTALDFTQRRSQKRMDFLDYWEEKKEKLNIVNSEDREAVRIMTIHKSKGLEFPVVIFPYDMEIYRNISPRAWYRDLDHEGFNGFQSMLISSGPGIKETGEQGRAIFEEQESQNELDTINLLYVCLTRAVERLFVITENRGDKPKASNTSDHFRNYLRQKGLWQENQRVYSFGQQNSRTKKEEEQAVSVQEDFISTSWQDMKLHVVANSAELWDSDRGEAIRYGNLVHEIMSRVITGDDLQKVLDQYVHSGKLDANRSKEIKNKIEQIIEHPDLKACFIPGVEVHTESPLLTSHREIVIPDRLVMTDEGVTIIDYKTGAPDISHKDQIGYYASVMSQMGYLVRECILVYIGSTIKVVKI